MSEITKMWFYRKPKKFKFRQNSTFHLKPFSGIWTSKRGQIRLMAPRWGSHGWEPQKEKMPKMSKCKSTTKIMILFSKYTIFCMRFFMVISKVFPIIMAPKALIKTCFWWFYFLHFFDFVFCHFWGLWGLREWQKRIGHLIWSWMRHFSSKMLGCRSLW